MENACLAILQLDLAKPDQRNIIFFNINCSLPSSKQDGSSFSLDLAFRGCSSTEKTVSNINSNTNQGTVVKFHPSRMGGKKKHACALFAILRYIKKACSAFAGEKKKKILGFLLSAAGLHNAAGAKQEPNGKGDWSPVAEEGDF